MSQKKGISIFLIAAGLAVFILFYFIGEKKSDTEYVHLLEQDIEDETIDKTEEAVSSMEVLKEPEIICAYICGKVKKAGIYRLSKGSRLSDFIKAAGGFSKHAAKEYLNLAVKIEDEQRVYVPSKKEVKKWEREKNKTLELENDKEQQVIKTTKININTAKKEELMTLTGIGEAKAEAIIYYRKTNGAFQTVEELMQISGIKEGIYQKICDNITV